jgi:hypothetical protein
MRTATLLQPLIIPVSIPCPRSTAGFKHKQSLWQYAFLVQVGKSKLRSGTIFIFLSLHTRRRLGTLARRTASREGRGVGRDQDTDSAVAETGMEIAASSSRRVQKGQE